MATYGALTDAFREFNRLLIDQQARKDAMAQNAAATEHRNAVLQSNLEQQHFNNAMAVKNLELAEKGEARLAAAQAERVRQFNQTHAIAKAAEERLKGQFGLDKQRFAEEKANNALRNQKLGLEMQKLQVEADLLSRQTDATDVDFSKWVSDEYMTNPEFLDDLNQYTKNTLGFSVGADGRAFLQDEPDATLQMKNYKQSEMLPAISALMAQHDDRHTKVVSNINEMEAEYKTLQSIANTGSDNYNFSERAAAKREMNKLKPQIKQHYDFFRPENQLEFHQGKVDELSQISTWLRSTGQDDMATSMEDKIKDHQDIVLAMSKELAKDAGDNRSVEGLRQHSIYKRELDSKGRAQYVGQAVYDVKTNTWSFVNEEGEHLPSESALPPDVQVGKPTETFGGKGGKSVPGMMTEAQMKNILPLYQTEGMDKIFASDAVKPKIRHMRGIMDNVYRSMGSKPEDRSYIQSQVVNKVEDLEAWYWEQVDPIDDLSKKQRRQVLKKLGRKPKKNQTAKQAIQDYYYEQFRDFVRQVAGDDTMRIYRPNKTTKKMTFGLSGFEE